MNSERRRAPRYQFIADAVVTELVSGAKFAARTSDLSIGGCFVDMLNPPPEGTDIRIEISHEGTTLAVLGTVVFVVPNMGMGVRFTSAEPMQLSVLEKWLDEAKAPR